MWNIDREAVDGFVGVLEASTGDVAAALQAFSRDYLRLVCSPGEHLGAARLMHAEAERAGNGKMFMRSDRRYTLNSRCTSLT